MHVQLSWRNIWRNPRRTAVIMIAVIIGVWSMIFLGALMRGMVEDMLDNGIATLTGDIQIHQKNYRDDPAVENSMTDTKNINKALKKVLPDGARSTSRIRVNGVASNARHSAGVTIVGIHPVNEVGISFIGEAVAEGRYLRMDDNHGIIVGKALLDKFETRLGKKLILMSQDTEKEIASRAFRIVGVFKAELEATEKQFVFTTLSAAQKMLKLENGISEISIVLPGHKKDNKLVDSIKSNLSSDVYEINTWQELLPILVAYLRIFDEFMYIWYVVTFVAMGFGIVNTTLMAIFERMREFGLLKALGMKPRWIIRGVLTESFFLLIFGMAIGNLLGFLSVFALSGTGIDLSRLAAGTELWGMAKIIYPSIAFKDVVTSNMVVLVLGLLVCLYPAVKAARFTVVEALTHT
ncbi:MAG: ABC transporter permease [Deltaproteobacteria bacterium]|nr:ABC transporter permease [Deltaproteobacteria bacterium]MBW1985478.1 ABC transporter permease [Deltaproteobacteria bacterium]